MKNITRAEQLAAVNPNFSAAVADIRDDFSADARDRKACDVAAAMASNYVDPQINLAANLVRQQHVGTHEALVLLHAILRNIGNDEHYTLRHELSGLVLSLTDDVIDIAKAHGTRDPDAKRDEERDDALLGASVCENCNVPVPPGIDLCMACQHNGA